MGNMGLPRAGKNLPCPVWGGETALSRISGVLRGVSGLKLGMM